MDEEDEEEPESDTSGISFAAGKSWHKTLRHIRQLSLALNSWRNPSTDSSESNSHRNASGGGEDDQKECTTYNNRHHDDARRPTIYQRRTSQSFTDGQSYLAKIDESVVSSSYSASLNDFSKLSPSKNRSLLAVPLAAPKRHHKRSHSFDQ
jgi:hypothetical protein